MFTLPQVREKLGAWDESKHPRGQPKNRGEFRSGGGGGGSSSSSGSSGGGHHISQSGMSPRMGILIPPTPKTPGAKPKPTPPPLPGHQQAGLQQLFGGASPSRPPEHDANYKPDNPLRPPGTGPRPENLGSPGSVDEARDQLIWLLGRSSILREQGRAAGRATPKMTRELTLNINLASRLQHGFFKLPDKPPQPMTGPKAQEAAAPKAEPKKEPDIRSNPLLEEAFNAPSEKKPEAAGGDMRHNPLLDEAMGMSSNAPSGFKEQTTNTNSSVPWSPSPGMVRLYHGGGEYKGGTRWVSASRDYAEGYARKSGGQLHYADVPENHPEVQANLDTDSVAGTSMRAPLKHFDASESIARQLKPHPTTTSKPVSNTTLPAAAVNKPASTPPPLPKRSGAAQPPPLPQRPNSTAGTKPAKPKPPKLPAQRPTSSSHIDVRHISESIAGNFNRQGANHADVGGEIERTLSKHPEHIGAAFRRRHGITESMSREEAGRQFISSQRSGYSKDPELKPAAKKRRQQQQGFAGMLHNIAAGARLANTIFGSSRKPSRPFLKRPR